MRPDILLLNLLTEDLETQLAERYAVHRLYSADDPEGLLDCIGPNIRAVIAGGHIGLPTSIAEALPNLEIVAINGVGYDRVDLERARRHGYCVATTPDVLTDDVADLAISLTLSLVRRVSEADRFVRAGRWTHASFGLSRRVSGLDCGIFGMGRIGEAVAHRLSAFGATIAYCSRRPKDTPYRYYSDLKEMARAVDVLILTAAATPATHQIVNASVIAALGPDGLLVNVARGALVDQRALATSLVTGRLGGAALDVFEIEPMQDQALVEAPNTVLTPHIGSATLEARKAMGALVLANLDAHFSGRHPPGAIIQAFRWPK